MSKDELLKNIVNDESISYFHPESSKNTNSDLYQIHLEKCLEGETFQMAGPSFMIETQEVLGQKFFHRAYELNLNSMAGGFMSGTLVDNAELESMIKYEFQKEQKE